MLTLRKRCCFNEASQEEVERAQRLRSQGDFGGEYQEIEQM